MPHLLSSSADRAVHVKTSSTVSTSAVCRFSDTLIIAKSIEETTRQPASF